MRAIAPRNGTLDRNTVSGWNSRADISGNARHFCDCELNFRIRGRTPRTEPLDWYTARDSERVVRIYQEVDVSPVSPSSTTRMWEKAVIGDDGSQVSRKGLSTVVRTNLERLEPMPFRTQLYDVRYRAQKWNVGKSFTVWRIWDVGIANDIEWLIYKTIQYKLYAVINLNSKVNKPLRLSKRT